MSRTGIVYNDVANAAVKLQGLNETPTVDRVREILGTGSKSTIARHLKDWKNNNGPVASTNNLPEELIAIISGLWENLQLRANQAISQHQEQADQAITAIQNSLIEAENVNSSQQSQIQQLESKLSQEQNTSQTLNDILTNARLEYSKNQERTNNLEIQLAEQKQENTKLHNLLINVQNNLEHYQAAMQQQQQEQFLLAEQQKSRLENELASLREKLFAADLQIEKLTQNLAHSARENELQKNILLAKTQELADTSKQLIEADKQNAILENWLSKANERIRAARKERLIIAQERGRLQRKIASLPSLTE